MSGCAHGAIANAHFDTMLAAGQNVTHPPMHLIPAPIALVHMHDTSWAPHCMHAGTMLFGESQDYPTACQLLDECMAAGVNFFDTAEMYPVPQRAETQGCSEECLGKWMQKHSRYAMSVQVAACCWILI